MEEVSEASVVGSGGALGGQGDHRRPRGALEEKVVKTIVLYSISARERPFRRDETRANVRKCSKNLYFCEGAPHGTGATALAGPNTGRQEPYSESSV